MKSLSLYTMSQEMQALIEADEVNDDLLVAAIGDIEKKSENVCHFIRNVESTVDIFKAEEKRIASRRKALENTITRVKEYAKTCMELMGAEKIDTGTFTLSIQNNPPALQIEDGAEPPAEYCIIIPEQRTWDKDKVKSDLKSGKMVPGATLTVGRSIRIR